MTALVKPVPFSAAMLAAIVVALTAGSVGAQTTYTWDGGGGDNLWTTGANWVGDVAPVRGSSTFLTFAGSTRTSPFNNQGDWQQLAGMTFASGASSFRIEGNNIGFVNASGEQVITQNAAATQEINATFSFGSNQDSRINLNAGDLLISSGNVYIDVNASQYRQFYISGSDGTRRTVTFTGNVRNSGSGLDADLVINNNKRVLVTGTLLNGNGNDASVFVNDGVLQFSGAGTMPGGRPAIGNTSGSGNAAVWLDTAGTTFTQELELRNGSSGRRTVGGLNTSGTVTFSGQVVGNAGEYDLAANSGGTTVFSGARNYTSTVHVNRPDGATTYGGTVILSGTTNSTGGTGVYGGTLQFSDFNQLSTGYIGFELDSGDSGTLRYTGGSTSVTRQLWANKAQTRAAIDVAQAGTTLTWTQSGGTFNRNLTKVGAGTLAFSVPITGTGGNVAVEAGMLILTGSNSYSGGTVVSGGTLEVSAGGSQGGSPAALGTGTVSIASGAQVKYWLSTDASNTVANPFSLSGGTLHTTDGYNTYSGLVTLASGSSTISAQYEDTITLSGGLAGGGNVLITQAGGTGGWAAPTYVLSGAGANTGTVRVSGTSGGGATKLQLANVNALQAATLDLATGDTGLVEFTVPGANTYALGGLQGSRNLAAGGNSLTVGGNGQSTTYSGNLSGSGLFTKAGSGTLTLSGSNALASGAALNGGILALGSADALGSTGTISFAGGTLQYSSANATDYSARFSTAAGQRYSIDTNGRSLSLGTALTSSGGSLTKLGGGTLTLALANTYTGTTTVSGGQLALGASGVLADTSAVVVAGGELAVGGNSETVGSFAISAGSLTGSGTLTAATYGLGGGTVSGNLGAGAMTVTGNATLDGLTNATALALNAGTLSLGSGGRLVATTALAVTGSAGASLVLGGNETVGSLAGGANVSLGSSVLTVGAANVSTTYSGGFSGAGSVAKVGSGTLTVSGSSSHTGGVSVSAGTVQVSGDGIVGGSVAGLGSGTVSIAAGSQVTYWLSTSSGNTIANPFVIAGGTLHTEDGGNTFSGAITLAAGTSTISGRYQDYISLTGGLAGPGSVIFGQQGVSGSNAPSFLVSGTGTMTGTVRITGSSGGAATTLYVNSTRALQNATLDMAAGDAGTVVFGGGSLDPYRLGGLEGSRDLSFVGASLDVGGNGLSTTYSGRLSGATRFTKSGTGTLLLSGSSGGMTAPVQVDAGRLEIGPTGWINASSSVSITGTAAEFRFNSSTPLTAALAFAGGTLSGTGTIGVSAGIASTATVISPGNSPGIMPFGTSQSWSAFTYLWELNDFTTGTAAGVNFDQIAIAGGLNLTGNQYVLDITSLTAGNVPGDVGNFSDVSRSWTILTTTGGITGFDPSEWTLSTAAFTTGGAFSGTWTLAQQGNDLVLTAVPEPSTVVLAAIGMALVIGRRRRFSR